MLFMGTKVKVKGTAEDGKRRFLWGVVSAIIAYQSEVGVLVGEDPSKTTDKQWRIVRSQVRPCLLECCCRVVVDVVPWSSHVPFPL